MPFKVKVYLNKEDHAFESMILEGDMDRFSNKALKGKGSFIMPLSDHEYIIFGKNLMENAVIRIVDV